MFYLFFGSTYMNAYMWTVDCGVLVLLIMMSYISVRTIYALKSSSMKVLGIYKCIYFVLLDFEMFTWCLCGFLIFSDIYG